MKKTNEYDKNEKDYINTYQDMGYVSNFYFKDNELINSETKNAYVPDEIFIVAEHRYEGMSNPSDMSILYIIETSKGEKGTFLMAYGPEASFDDAQFFRKVPKTNVSDKKNINLNNNNS